MKATLVNAIEWFNIFFRQEKPGCATRLRLADADLNDKVDAMLDCALQAGPALSECYDALAAICRTLGLDLSSTEVSDIPVAVSVLDAECGRLRHVLANISADAEGALHPAPVALAPAADKGSEA